MNFLSVFGLFSLYLFVSASYAASTPEEFFQKFRHLGSNFDPSIASLYSDNAKIHAYRVYPHGLERNMELTGVQWKQLVQKIMPAAKAQNDKNAYSNVVITQLGKGYKIKADRYSARKCYTDTGYYLIVAPDDNIQLLVVEEYIETKALPNC